MPTAQRRFLIGALLLFFLTACTPPPPPAPAFGTIHRQYVQSLRWADYNGIARFLAPADREKFLASWLEEENLHIVDVTPESIDYRDMGTPVSTRIVVEYYRLPSVTIRKLRIKQQWTYQPLTESSQGGWQLSAPPPPLP